MKKYMANDPYFIQGLAIDKSGNVTLYTGRVDLGTGTETVFAQFAAEELDVEIGKVRVVMGDTRLTPDQGKTTASLNVVRGSQPVRIAGAQAFDRRKVTSLDGMDYRILTFAELPEVKTHSAARAALVPAGEAWTVATAAALANAVFDAIGKHPRRLPLTPDYVNSLI